ncbi:MAG: D-aminoacyl-tRNA deacylase [Phycisphaerales bacterium]
MRETDRVGTIESGLCVLLGVEEGDQERDAVWMAGKLARLRIFADDEGRMNRSVIDVGGSILLISQFTLAGDCSRGNRPSFVSAAQPSLAQQLYDRIAALLQHEHNLEVVTGDFGASMAVEIHNDGPVTIIVRSEGV